MRVFVISLPGDDSRRSFMREQLEGLGIEYEFFDAVRGSERLGDSRWYDPEEARRREDRSLRAGEVGCALSHAALYAEIARRGLPWALILEDDARLHPDLPKVLAELEKGLIEQGDIVFLERCDHYRRRNTLPLFGKYRIVEPRLVRFGSCCQSAGYIISQGAAENMKDKNIPVKFPADNWGYYAGLVRFKGVIPSLTLIRQNVGLGSTITQDNVRREFSPYSMKDLLWNGFKVYTPIGRFLKRKAKKMLGKINHGRD